MDRLIFAMTPGLLVRLVGRYLLIPLAFGALLALAGRRISLADIAVGVLMVVVPALLAAGARTMLTGEGIHVRRFFVFRTLHPWGRIAQVYEDDARKATVLRVRTHDGRVITLPYPTTAPVSPDPGFAADRDQAVALWRRHAAVPSAG